MWIKHSDEDLVALFGEISQEITRRGDLGSGNLRMRFPRSIIKTLKEYESRFPYLDDAESRNIACALQLCDANRWFSKSFDLALTAGSMWEWQITLPIAAIIETLLKQYLKLQGWQPDKDKFDRYIDECVHRELFDNDLQERLHSLRVYRNKIHLHLNDHIPISSGDFKTYNEATDLLSIVESILIKHWTWHETMKLIASDYFKIQLSEKKYGQILMKGISEAFTEMCRTGINWKNSHNGQARIVRYGVIENPTLTDLCFLPDTERPATFSFNAFMDVRIKYSMSNSLLNALKETGIASLYLSKRIDYIVSTVEEKSRVIITGKVKFDKTHRRINKAEGIGMEHFALSVQIVEYSKILDGNEPRQIDDTEPIRYHESKISLLDAVKNIYSNKHVVTCNGVKALNEKMVIIVDTKIEAQFYAQLFDLIQLNKSFVHKKIKFITAPDGSDAIQIAEVIHSAHVRVICIIKREKLKEREFFSRLLHSFGLILSDYIYAMNLYDKRYNSQNKSSDIKTKGTKEEWENTGAEWEKLIKLLHNIGIFILPDVPDNRWFAGFFEPNKGGLAITEAIKHLSKLKESEKYGDAIEQTSWQFMNTVYKDIRYLHSTNFEFRQSVFD